MTLNELYTKLNTVLPDKVTYRCWEVGNAPTLPFICYYCESTSNFNADNKTYNVIQNVVIELYSRNKDLETESTLETMLADAGINWEKYEDYLDDENCFEISYDITI